MSYGNRDDTGVACKAWEEEDVAFIKRFLLASGSLKEIGPVRRKLPHSAAAARAYPEDKNERILPSPTLT